MIREKELKLVILEDLQQIFKTFQDESFIKSLQKKLSNKKRSIEKQISIVENNIKELRIRKKGYLDLYTDNVISREELIEAREITDQKLTELDLTKSELQERLEECTNENYAIDLGSKLKEFLLLKDLTPQLLHSLVEKITCSIEGEIRIHYNFVNPFEEA